MVGLGCRLSNVEDDAGTEECAISARRALLAKSLDGVDDAETVADGGDAHLLEGGMVEVKNKVCLM